MIFLVDHKDNTTAQTIFWYNPQNFLTGNADIWLITSESQLWRNCTAQEIWLNLRVKANQDYETETTRWEEAIGHFWAPPGLYT